MRKTRLNQVSGVVVLTVVSVAVLASFLRVLALELGSSANQGKALYVEKGCVHCHYTDSKETKIAPGLKGLFSRDILPASGRAATEGNVRQQLRKPCKSMPSFADRLTEREMDELIAYLKTL